MSNPEFWALSSWLDIVASYRRSRMGLFWMIMPINVYVWGVGSFFSGIMGKGLASFAAHVAIGVTVFRLLNSMIMESTGVMRGSQSFILDGHTCLTDFVLRLLAKALFYVGVALPVIAIAMVIHPQLHVWGLLWMVPAFALVLVNALWIGLSMSLVGARFPDVSQLTGSIFIFAFLLTPIVWSADMVPAGTLRAKLMLLNPLYHLIECVRAPVLGEPLSMISVQVVVAMAVVGWVLTAWAYRRYARFVPLWM
nr:ABC transporter permease [Luteimonas sp. XNQY3]